MSLQPSSLPSFRFLFSSSFHFVVVCTVLLAPSLFQSFQSCTLQFQFCLFLLLDFLVPVHGLLSFFDLPKTLFALSLMLPKSYHIFSPDHLCLLKLQTYSSPPKLFLNVGLPPDLFTSQLLRSTFPIRSSPPQLLPTLGVSWFSEIMVTVYVCSYHYPGV